MTLRTTGWGTPEKSRELNAQLSRSQHGFGRIGGPERQPRWLSDGEYGLTLFPAGKQKRKQVVTSFIEISLFTGKTDVLRRGMSVARNVETNYW